MADIKEKAPSDLNYTVEDIRKVHSSYTENLRKWRLYRAVYKGIDEIIRGDYIPQHEREPNTAYIRRMQELYSFSYGKSVCGIFTYHLLSKPTTGRKLAELEKNDFWQMFFKDSDLFGNAYDELIQRIALQASIFGHMGILVDKPPVNVKTVGEQKENGLYPYIAQYFPSAILDWKWERDPVTRRPFLSYLKLLDDDGRYRIWRRDFWAVYEVLDESGNPLPPNLSGFQTFLKPTLRRNPQGTRTSGPRPAPGRQPKPVSVSGEGEAKVVTPVEFGENILNEIPFLWIYNRHTDEKGIGESDLTDIAGLEISIIKNASQIEEIINYAAFPIMAKPKKDADPTAQDSDQEDEISVQSIIEFDPENPESKPFWLTPQVEQALMSILNYIKHKVAEIYRASNIGGIAGTEISTTAKSGVALKAEFQILNSTLVGKAINLEKGENKILEFWLKWEQQWEPMKDKVNFSRSRNFNVEDVAADLENALTAKTVVLSKTFSALLQKNVARQVLPSMSEDDQKTIDEEIETASEKEPDPGTNKTDSMDDIDDADDSIINEGTQEE